MAYKLLLVDDSVNLLQALRRRFEIEIPGIQVFMADNGVDGLALAQEQVPDLIFLDVSMPGMTGEEVLDALKAGANTDEGRKVAQVPVIILTSHGPEEREKFLLKGAYDYVCSPFDTNELVLKAKKIFGIDE